MYLGYFSSLEKITITYNFFASYHGKGPCDGHTGVLSSLWRSSLSREIR